jgi:outer membrane protein assembly factor BamB
MRILRLAALLAAVTGALMLAADWPMQSGNPQRNGWARSERFIKKANVSGLKLLYKYQADNLSKGFNSLTPPIINGNLITYRGFKEMLIFGGSSDKIYSVDADLNQLLWKFQIEPKTGTLPLQASTGVCSGGLTAPVIMAGSSSAPIHFTALASRNPAASGVKPVPAAPKPSPYFPPLSQTLSPLLPTTLTQLAALYAVSSDGTLHIVNSSTGQDLLPSFNFLPPNAKVTSLNIRDNVVYATTADSCDGGPNALYALDLLSSNKKVATFVTKTGNFSGAGGTTIGNDGTVYVQTASGPDDAAGKPHETIYALTPKDLRVKDYFTLPGKPLSKKSVAAPGITPLVFSGKVKDMLVAGGRDGRLYLLDSTSLGGADHHTPFFQTEVIASRSKNYDGNGFRGTFSSWQNADTNTRWIYAPLYGVPNAAAHLTTDDQGPSSGSIVAFKLEGTDGQRTLRPVWISRDLVSPASVVIAGDIVFALSTGEPTRIAKKNGKPYSASEWQGMSSHAALYAFDAVKGKELYSSGNAVSGYSHGDLAVANGRVYFTTHDNAVYCFGFPKEQTQLAEQ